MRDIKVLLKQNVDCTAKRNCAGVTMDAKQLANMLSQNLWLAHFCPVTKGKTVQLTFWSLTFRGKFTGGGRLF